MHILENIHGHSDLEKLDQTQLLALCQEIREFLINNISRTGGHLASNLGVVELSVALETVFNTNKDRLVFDVGHQSYVHKLLTGRQACFSQLRQFGGMAGFPKPSESDADAFVAGHASSSVSIALGMARARTLLNDDYHVAALIGDGSATGGMAYEGLNDAAESGEPMVVILNDNEMSISPNVGGLARHLSRLRTRKRYLGMKERYRNTLSKTGFGRTLYHITRRIKDRLKRFFLRTTIFENMGFTYLGPVDGHDVCELIELLRYARDLKRPVLVHVLTQKGKGYRYAEDMPAKFHGVGKFDPASGESLKAGVHTFSDTFGQTLCYLAKEDPKVCAITAAMPAGTGLMSFQKQYPTRLFDVGIAEEHAVSMAGGLAKQGMTPVVALYSTFLQRSFDQIMQDIGLLQLHVVLGVDRAGLVGEDGETHHGIFDVGFLRQVPGMTLLAPASCAELKDMLTWAVTKHNGPVAIRYPRGGDGIITGSAWKNDLSQTICPHTQGNDATIITYGTITEQAIGAAGALWKQGLSVQVLRLEALSPLPSPEVLAKEISGEKVFVLEEVCSGSGIYSDICAMLHEDPRNIRCFRMDLGSNFVTHGNVKSLYRSCGVDAESIASRIWEVCAHEG